MLGEGYTVDYSVARAYEITIDANLEANGKYTEYDLENGLIPEEIETQEILCGLDSYCVVGNGGQIIMH